MRKKYIPIRKEAIYRGYRISVMKMDDEYYYVATNGDVMPSGLFVDMECPGKLEYRGKILKSDPDLEFV